MTLLLTHFTPYGVIFAADRAIVEVDNNGNPVKFKGFTRKIFQISSSKYEGGIGFFGLASVNTRLMSDWLERFINERITPDKNIEEFIEELKVSLEHERNKSECIFPSGFHIGGYNFEGKGFTQFFYLLKNYKTKREDIYGKVLEKYEYKNHLHEYKNRLSDYLNQVEIRNKFVVFHFHNGSLQRFLRILNKSYKEINRMSPTRFFKKFDSLSKYESYAVNIFKGVINQSRRELKGEGIMTINTETGEPDCFTIASPG